MLEQVKAIAIRLKEIREISGLSIAELAAKLKIEPEEYEAYESGKVDIPVSLLYAIGNYFNVELTTLLTGADPKLRDYAVVRKNKGIIVKRRKNYHYQNLAYNFANKQIETFLVTIDPDKSDKTIDFNSHCGQEFNYMLEGSMRLIIDGKELILNPGDSIYYNAELPHAMESISDEKAIFLAIISDSTSNCC